MSQQEDIQVALGSDASAITLSPSPRRSDLSVIAERRDWHEARCARCAIRDQACDDAVALNAAWHLLDEFRVRLVAVLEGHCANSDRIFCGTCSKARKLLARLDGDTK